MRTQKCFEPNVQPAEIINPSVIGCAPAAGERDDDDDTVYIFEYVFVEAARASSLALTSQRLISLSLMAKV
jgi:hypothetical protein